MFKLNFYRFVEFEQLTLGLDVNTGNTKSKTKEYRKDVEENVIATNEKAMTSMDKTNAKTETLWSGKSLTGVRTAIRNYKQQFKEMQDLAKSPFASAKYKLEAQNFLIKDRLSGLSSLNLKDASGIKQATVNKLMSGGESMGKKNISEMAKQEKLMTQYTKEAIQQLQIQNTVIEQQQSIIEKQPGPIAKFNNAMNSATEATNRLSTAFKKKIASLKHAAVSWRILYGAFSQIWNVLAGTVEKAAAYQEALNLYTIALGEYAEQGSEWANRISTALFLDPKQIMQYTGAFYNLVQGLGVGSEAAYKMSTNLTQLSYDMSSYLNIDVEAAHDKLQSAMTGQSRAVASAGIAMQQASLQELAYSMGIQKSISSMTQAEKTYLRYIQIMRSTANMQGDLARTIVTPENALRVVKQQFELLARAIGNVFIPIVMSAIPYVMALTRALTQLATWLGGKLGFKVAEIDYSSLKTADVAIEDTFNNIGSAAGKGAKAVSDGVSRTLAAFDELNVVESQNKGAGGGGGVGGVGGVGGIPLGDLDKYVDGYDMLQGLTDELSKKTDAAYENLKKLWNVIKGIGIAFATWKLLKLGNTIIEWVKNFAALYNAGKGIPGLMKNVVFGIRDFVTWFKVAKATGLGTLDSIRAASDQVLGPIGQLVVSIGSVVTAFTSGYSIFSKWDMTMEDFGSRALKTTAIVGGLTAATFLLVNPWAAAGVAVAGFTGSVLGGIKAMQEYEKELEKERAYDKLFDGVGISIETITASFRGLATDLTGFYSELGNAHRELEKTSGELSNAQTAFIDLHNAFQAGVNDDVTFNKLTASVETFKDKLNESREANINYNKTVIDNLLKEGQINKEEYDKMTKNITDYYTKMALYQSDYADELALYDTQLKQHAITQEEYNEKVANLEKRYAGVITSLELSGSALEKLYSVYGRKINFRNEEEVKKLYEDLTKAYEDSKNKIDEQHKASNDYLNEQIAHNKLLIQDLEKRKDSWSDIDKEMYTTATNALNSFQLEQKKVNDQYTKDLQTLQAQYGNYLATINAQLVDSGAYMVDEMEETYDNIKDALLRITKDTSIQNAPNDLFGNWITQFQVNGKKLGTVTDKIFGEVGISATDELFYNVSYGTEKGFTKLNEDIQYYGHGIRVTYGEIGRDSATEYTQEHINQIQNSSPGIVKEYENVGFLTGLGLVRGYLSGNPSFSIANDIKNNLVGNVKTMLGIASPSRVFEEIGTNIMLGLANGISKNMGFVQERLNTLINNMYNKVNSTNFNFTFNSNVDNSFNSLLHKLQNFVDKWRTGINETLKKTANAFGSIVMTSANKVKYSIMEAIRVPTFAEGGYPRSGDLFYANENGMPEYVTSLGNKSAVVNQDQMITALSNAIVTAVGNASLNNNQPSTIVVQIGNEKVYEGHGQYQNRQADRYGTTYVKI